MKETFNRILTCGCGIILAILFLFAPTITETFKDIGLSSEIYCALIGVLITVLITALLLRRQSESEKQKEKDIKIYQKKLKIYSAFTSEMWATCAELQELDDFSEQFEKKMRELRTTCFNLLVFYLSDVQIKKITQHVTAILESSDPEIFETLLPEKFKEITRILQKNLSETEKIEEGLLTKLFKKIFNKKQETLVDLFKAFTAPSKERNESDNDSPVPTGTLNGRKITFWHFNAWSDKQIKTFEEKNWVLNLIEYNENWRTNLLRQVKKDDVVFLYRRGGNGYIGAFKVTGHKILTVGDVKELSPEDKEKFDIYGALEDGASYSSNLSVNPIAYNWKGVGYLSVRRRTIERMNDMESVRFLLNKFNGNDLTPDKKEGMDKFENGKVVKLERNEFEKIYSTYIK